MHRPVMLDEVVEALQPKPGSIIVDGTAGAGGHSRAIAERVGNDGRVIAFDRDARMIELARRAVEGLPVDLVHRPYSELVDELDARAVTAIDGVVLDLGLSSDQLAWEDRGFSFAADGPLDMRFDRDDGPTAADLVNSLSAEELANLIFEYGEERYSRRVARRIVEARKLERITTTARLAELVRSSIPGKWGPIDPATRTFQALRIAVNRELDHLDRFLETIAERLKPGARVAIISFHSLEDRKVKWAFREDPRLEPLTRKPLTARAEETNANPRSRSAKLRVAERCQEPTGTPNPKPGKTYR
ncbi:MAG: 16S rRNA (cytosine(1402)-N(4))-methyltransferase RsmH [Isosphaeraceae bacterium]|nr:16S rRNA (cytosine(1402)-N(4))-methyltransferase RsmH [Isosphaeraceae bacterium]